MRSRKKISSVAEQNLALNFPTYEVAMRLEDTEARLGPNFRRIMENVMKMKDTFGLCSLLAFHASSLLTAHNKWKVVDYDPKILKGKFDSRVSSGSGQTVWRWFKNQYCYLFGESYNYRELEVTTQPQMLELFSRLGSNQGIILAFLCDYPKRGIYTHWLAAEPSLETDSILIAGDLSPFGIPAVGITTELEIVFQGIQRVIGASPSTEISSQLTGLPQNKKLESGEYIFTKNFCVISF